MGNYGYVAVFLLGGLGFVCFNLTLASIVSRLGSSYRPGYSKGIAYECGEPPIGEAWVQYNVRYYLYAMLFVLFDVEAAFLIPWAADFQTLYRSLGPLILLEIVSFLGILGAALVYAWKKGVLEWV
jgi:NADH-quinone oxidoreductase subunit A